MQFGVRHRRPSSSVKLGMAHFRGFALALSFVGLAVIAVLMWTRHEVRRQLARRVADVLNEWLASAGYHVTIRSATWAAPSNTY